MLIIIVFSLLIGCFGFIFVKSIIGHYKERNYKLSIISFFIALIFLTVGFGMFTYFVQDYVKDETIIVEGYLQDIESTGKAGDHVITINNERLLFTGSTVELEVGTYYIVEYWASSTIVKSVKRKEELP